MKARDFDRKFDRGESVLSQLDLSNATRPDQEQRRAAGGCSMNDPIVEEVRRVREQLLAECGGDFHAYMERLRESQEQDRDRLVTKKMEIVCDGT